MGDHAPVVAAGDAAPPLDATPTSVEDVVTLRRSCSCSSPAWSVPEWTPRPDVTVCSECRRPSVATVERLTGERAGLASIATAPARDVNAAPSARRDDVECLIECATSQADLASIWQAAVAAGTWTDAHSALAGEIAPSLPPTSDLPL